MIRKNTFQTRDPGYMKEMLFDMYFINGLIFTPLCNTNVSQQLKIKSLLNNIIGRHFLKSIRNIFAVNKQFYVL